MIGYPKKQKTIVKSLGITKMNQIVERADNPSMRGIVEKVPHLLRIVE
jgi:large subunit ribosomal protein L30